MKIGVYLILFLLLISCSESKQAEKKARDRDFYDDYADILDAMRLEIAFNDSNIEYGDSIKIYPELFVGEKKMLFNNYDIWYTIDKTMNLDSAHHDYDGTYGATKARDSIIYISDSLPHGSHYISILCQLDVDAGFSITKNVSVMVSEKLSE